jgi:hypothetical protein
MAGAAVTSWTADAWAQTTSASSTAPTAAQPASTSATAASPTQPARGHEENLSPALVKMARDSFVIVEFWYKKDLSEVVSAEERDSTVTRIYEEYVDQKRPDEKSGVVLDAAGHVLIVDEGVEDRFIDKIVVRDAEGNPYPARRVKLLADAPGVLLQVEEGAARKLHPPQFAALDANRREPPLHQVKHYQEDDQWRISAEPLAPAVRYSPATRPGADANEMGNLYYALEMKPSIVADTGGAPLGVALASFMDLMQRQVLWKGPDLLADKGTDWPELQKLHDSQQASLVKAVQEVVIRFRGSDEDDRSSAAGAEINVYGLAISATDVLVLNSVSSRTAAQIDKIFLKFSPTRRAEAKFVGEFKKFGAIVVRLEKEKLSDWVKLSDLDDPPRMKPFWEAKFRKRFGNKHVDLAVNRIFTRSEGYEGKFHWDASRDLTDGSAMVDLDGRLLGLYVEERPENEEESRLASSGGGGRSRASRTRIFTMGEVREALTKLTDLDPKIVVKTAREAKRRPWLGVEFVGISSDLAEQFGAERPTNDGQIGFVVNAVYPDSPAQKAGIRVGDILLKLQAPGQPYPIELSSRLAREESGGGLGSRFLRGGGEDDEEGGRTWRSRDNFLTRAFDAIGVGKTVKISYYRPDEKSGQGKGLSLDYTIEQAPTDFDSSPRWRNRKLGLTVRDLSYEIRYALGLKDSDPGVVVAKVEEGSPMTVARVNQYEIVTRLDDQPLTSARQMRDLVAKAARAGKTKVRLTVLKTGRTRFADLAIGDYSAADDEGLGEE